MSKTAVSRCGLAVLALGSAVALTACGAGQISQTANQVAAVDGGAANSENGYITLRDVTVHPQDGSTPGAVKFSAANSDPSGKAVNLKSITVDNTKVTLDGSTELPATCSLIGDSAEAIKAMGGSVEATTAAASSSAAASSTTTAAATTTVSIEQADNCVSYLTTSFEGTATAGTSLKVTFTFDSDTITVDAPVAAATPESGTHPDTNSGTKESH